MAYIIATFLFTVALLLTGLWTMRWIRGVKSFVIAGREISPIIGVAGIAAMGVAGQMIVMQSALAVSFGYFASLSNVIPYAIIGMIFYGFTLAPLIRRSGAETIPEYVEMRFSSTKLRTIISLTQILGMMGVVAMSTVAMASIASGLLGWPWGVGVTVFFFMYVVFVVAGGFWAVSITDLWQLILALIILPATAFYLMNHFGGIDFILSNWPHNYWTTGYAGMKLPKISIVHPSYLTLGTIFVGVVWGSSYFWMRAASSRDERTARISYIGGGLIVLCLAPIGYSFFGTYAAVLNPGAFLPLGTLKPDTALGVLMKQMPLGVSLSLYIAVLMASISTGSLAVIGTSAAIQRDILGSTKIGSSVTGSRIVVMVTLICIWILCWYPKALVYLFSYSFAWFIPSAVAIWLSLYWRKVTATAIFSGALVSALAMAILQLAEITGLWKTWHIAHPAMIGSALSIVCMFIISFFTKPQYYGETKWTARPSNEELKSNVHINLEPLDKRIIGQINDGYNVTSDLLDMGKESPFEVYQAIEKLDKNRLIERQALGGLGFHTYSVTEKGEQFLGDVKPERSKMVEYGLDELSLEMLMLADKDPTNYAINFVNAGHTPLAAQSVITKLNKLGYVKSSGIYIRKVSLTDEGRQVLKNVEDVLFGMPFSRKVS